MEASSGYRSLIEHDLRANALAFAASDHALVVRFRHSISGCDIAQRAPNHPLQTVIFVCIGGIFRLPK
jgi:hypothetical protein